MSKGFKATMLIIIVCVVLAWPSYKHMTVRVHVVFTLPDGPYQLDHSRIGIHPMMAEYSRNITFISNGERGRTTPLRIDTCGGYPINCYYMDAPGGAVLRMDDAVSEHLLDLRAQKTYLVVRAGGEAYVGEMNNEYALWRITMEDESSVSSVLIDNVAAVPMASLTGNVAERYVGRLVDWRFGRLRFIPVSESPELPIRHLSG